MLTHTFVAECNLQTVVFPHNVHCAAYSSAHATFSTCLELKLLLSPFYSEMLRELTDQTSRAVLIVEDGRTVRGKLHFCPPAALACRSNETALNQMTDVFMWLPRRRPNSRPISPANSRNISRLACDWQQ